jgi:hypothetical protein
MRKYLEVRVIDIGKAENTGVDQGLLVVGDPTVRSLDTRLFRISFFILSVLY